MKNNTKPVNDLVPDVSETNPGHDADEELVAFARSPRERVVIAVRRYKSATYFDVRRFVLDNADEWRPTTKGVTVRLVDLEGLLVAVQRAIALRDADGSAR